MDLENFKHKLEQVEFTDVFGSVLSSDVDLAESKLQVSFPSQYRDFIEKFGTVEVGSESIFGLGGLQYLDVVTVTEHLRSKKESQFPLHLIPIRSDGFGNYDCINTILSDAIIEWSHEDNSEKMLAKNFQDWLDGIVLLVLESQ
ncbi:MAG: SMI1/KNR4 family protein [Pirellulales bacterium]|jgi:hypothetical protein